MYYAIRNARADEVIGVLQYDEKLYALPVVEMISKAQFETYLEFGIEELDAATVITELFARLMQNRIARGEKSNDA